MKQHSLPILLPNCGIFLSKTEYSVWEKNVGWGFTGGANYFFFLKYWFLSFKYHASAWINGAQKLQISDIDFSIHVEAALEEHYYTKRRQNSDGVCFNTHADVCWGLGKWQLYHVTPDVSRLVPGRCQETDKANTDGTKGYIKKKDSHLSNHI